MYNLNFISWLKGKSRAKTYDDSLADKFSKAKALQDWKDKTISDYLKKRDNELNESPYTTYVLTYCQYCNNFDFDNCFAVTGNIYTEKVMNCAKLKSNIKFLEEDELEYHCEYNP